MNPSEAYVSSIKRLTTALVILMLINIYVGYEKYLSGLRFQIGVVTEQLGQILDTLPQGDLKDAATKYDVAKFSETSLLYYVPADTQKRDDSSSKEKANVVKMLKSQTVPGVYKIGEFPTRLYTQSECLVIAASVGDTGMQSTSIAIAYGSDMISATIRSSYLVNFGHSCPGLFANFNSVTLLLVEQQDEKLKWLVGIPKSISSFIENASLLLTPSTSPPWKFNRGMLSGDVSESIVNKMTHYSSYQLYDVNAARHTMFRAANTVTQSYYAPDEWHQMVDELYEQQRLFTSVYGITTPAAIVLYASPVLASLIILLICNRLKNLEYIERGRCAWIVADKVGIVDRGIALATLLIPLLSVVVSFGIFSVVYGVGISIFGYNFHWFWTIIGEEAITHAPELSILFSYSVHRIYSYILLGIFIYAFYSSIQCFVMGRRIYRRSR